MKKIAVILLCIVSSFSFCYGMDIDARELKWSVYKPMGVGKRGAKAVVQSDNVVGIVGKVIVKYNGDIERVRNYRDSADYAGKPDVYKPIGAINEKSISEGEVFCASFDLEDGENVISSDRPPLRDFAKNKYATFNYMSYYFNSCGNMRLDLPIQYNIQVPEGEKFLYIGTLVYEFEGDFFTLKKITVIDEYDEAQAALDKLVKKGKYTLCRVDLNP